MLRDIIERLLAPEEDIEVVGEVTQREALLATAGRLHPDVVILGVQDEQLPDVASALFADHPSMRLLGVSGNGRTAFLYEMRPHRVPLGEVSPEELVRAIRERARRAANERLADR